MLACTVGILAVGVGLAAAGKPPGTPGGKTTPKWKAVHSTNGVHGSKVLWASPSGSGSDCTAHAPCSLTQAVTKAGPGSTVRVKHGTYAGGVVIDKQLQLRGVGHPTIDVSSSTTGVGIEVTSGGSGSTVSGFTVKNAPFEGILGHRHGHPQQPVE